MAAAPLRDSYESLQRRAEEAVGRGDFDEAIELHRRLVSRLARLSEAVLRRRPELHDMHRVARVQLAGMLRHQVRYAEALEVTEALVKTHPEDADIWERECAVLTVAKGDVSAAFRFGDVFKFVRDNLSTYLIVLVLTWVAGFVGWLGVLICGIGWLVTAPYASMVTSYLYGQAYLEAGGRTTQSVVEAEFA